MFSPTLGKIKKRILTVLWIEEKPHKQSIMTACPIDSPEVTTGENDKTSLIPEILKEETYLTFSLIDTEK